MATTLVPTAEVEPQEVGLDPERLARLDAYLDGFVERGHHKGSQLVITRGGRIAHHSLRGQRDAEAGLPVEPDTVWRIYSMTKPITSVAAMMLFEEGALSLQDPVSKFIPCFGDCGVYRRGMAAAPVCARASEPMLVWHLMTHTSGLTYGFQQANAVDEAYRVAGFFLDPPVEHDLASACEVWAGLPLLFEPGTEWNYSVSTDVLGHIIEVVSGQPLDEFFAERIFAPLGMVDSGFSVSEAQRARMSALYFLDPESASAVPYPGVDAVTTERPKLLAGGHGCASTAADYHRFTQMLLRRGELDGVRLLSPRTVDFMTTNHLPGNATLTEFGRPLLSPRTVDFLTTNHLPGNATLTEFGRPLLDLVINEGYGFGLGLSPLVDPIAAKTLAVAGEYRWEGAAGTAFWVDPAADMTVLFFTQVLFSGDECWIGMRRLVNQALVA